MEQLLLNHERLPDGDIFGLLSRDSALWLAVSESEVEQFLVRISALVALPWRIVLVESTSRKLWDALVENNQAEGALTSHRGFLHCIAADPSRIQLPPRALPVLFLNGVDGAVEQEERHLVSKQAATRRRLNMYRELTLASPGRVVVAGEQLRDVLSEIEDLWNDDFRSRLTFASADQSALSEAQEILSRLGGLPAVTFVHQGICEFADDVLPRALASLPSRSIRVRIATDDGDIEDRDITSAELPDHPLLDRYRLIRSEDLVRVTAEDLSKEDVTSFFEKSKKSWKPFSAGLPWVRDKSVLEDIVLQLQHTMKRGADGNSVRYIWADPGAGATTFAWTLAFEAARNGFPCLIAGEMSSVPSGLEIVNFLHRALPQQDVAGEQDTIKIRRETPWLLVFEETHWEGHESELVKFVAELRRSGRPVIVLLVLQNHVHPDLKKIPGTRCIAKLTHELSREQAVDLGRHLNAYIRHLGMAKEESQWVAFWEQHRTDEEINIASFWIALEFWLRDLIDLGDSIQGWLWSKFKDAEVSPELSKILLEIASYSIQRRSLPEALIHRPPNENMPISILLEDIRYRLPALALIQTRSERGRCWCIAHDILARYFLNSAYFDNEFLVKNGLGDISTQIELRLRMLSSAARNPLLAEKQLRPFAIDLAVNILKLDSEGSPEFFGNWRDVLAILESAPKSLSRTSRIFNHHVAISRRRVALREEFDATDQERKDQLQLAIAQLEFALNSLDEFDSDEGDLNLLNTLALVYQSRADLGIRLGDSAEAVLEFRQKATETIRRALSIDSSNSFVLETAAKSLLQRASIEKFDKVSAATEALSYVFQAVNLDSSSDRQPQLERLTRQALEILSAEDSDVAIQAMCDRGEPLGFLAKAWLMLIDGSSDGLGIPLVLVDSAIAKSALVAIEAAPRKNWLLLQLNYDLVVHIQPENFEGQLAVLEELGGTAYQMPPQQRLEEAILLHQVGRHDYANKKFAELRFMLKQRPISVSVPERLRWLLTQNRNKRLSCDAIVRGDTPYHPRAKVPALKNTEVPFSPEEFGYRAVKANTHLQCFVTFGAMGPYLKPARDQI